MSIQLSSKYCWRKNGYRIFDFDIICSLSHPIVNEDWIVWTLKIRIKRPICANWRLIRWLYCKIIEGLKRGLLFPLTCFIHSLTFWNSLDLLFELDDLLLKGVLSFKRRLLQMFGLFSKYQLFLTELLFQKLKFLLKEND